MTRQWLVVDLRTGLFGMGAVAAFVLIEVLTHPLAG